MSNLKTEILSIGKFLQIKELRIPAFQRPYKWSVKNVIQLIDDIQRFKGLTPYRIGTIVIYRENELAEIVDGQQRTITFLLIVKAILAIKYKDLQGQDLRKILFNIKGSPFHSKFKNEITKKNIQNNYTAIERRIANVDEEFIDFFLNKCEITHFVIDDISEAFQFFDSQNARGRDLEPHDLLKAFHLRELDCSEENISEKDISELVDTWEDMDIKELSRLFADFLYRVRGWSKGNSSRYFTKKDTSLFKGINLTKIEPYPYTEIFRIIDGHVKESDQFSKKAVYPFQLDQTIINGKYFFEMVTHYKKVYDEIGVEIPSLSPEAKLINATLNDYAGMARTGDKYIRMLFNCALLYYVDKFGYSEISKAIEKFFIWAYTLRLRYHNLQFASVDNYVVKELNLFKIIREAIYKEDVINHELPIILDGIESEKTVKIKDLFIKMKYYANEK